jgi:hypothetical protein
MRLGSEPICAEIPRSSLRGLRPSFHIFRMAPPTSPSPSTAQLSVVIDDALPGVIELRATGVINLPELRSAHRELALARARRSDLRCMVFDAEQVERFGRGAVVEAARWITRNARLFDLAITITRSPSLKGSANALATCAPTLRHAVVADRAEAEAMLRSSPIAMTG